MKSLYSEASILPRRMSAAVKRCRSSWERVSFATCEPYSSVDDLQGDEQLPHVGTRIPPQRRTVIVVVSGLVGACRGWAVVRQLLRIACGDLVLVPQCLDAFASDALVAPDVERLKPTLPAQLLVHDG